MFSQQQNNNIELFLSCDLADSAGGEISSSESNNGFHVLSEALGLDGPVGAVRMILTVLDASNSHLQIDENLIGKYAISQYLL